MASLYQCSAPQLWQPKVSVDNDKSPPLGGKIHSDKNFWVISVFIDYFYSSLYGLCRYSSFRKLSVCGSHTLSKPNCHFSNSMCSLHFSLLQLINVQSCLFVWICFVGHTRQYSGLTHGSAQRLFLTVFQGTIHGARDWIRVSHIQGKQAPYPLSQSLQLKYIVFEFYLPITPYIITVIHKVVREDLL